jgi:hypothetical protein
MRIGGVYWDESNGILWYQLYAYYDGSNRPVLAATRLLDTVDAVRGGNYRTVGTQYGPWWYRANTQGSTTPYWKAVCNWLVPVPPDVQGDLGNRKFVMGGNVGAVGGAGNLGPGFQAISALPSLSDPPNTAIPNGLHLADYTSESTQNPPHAHREAGYTPLFGRPLNPSGLVPPSGSVGYWQMSLDQVNSFIWVETDAVEGILMFGRQSKGYTLYGHNPWSITAEYPGPPDAIDPTRPTPDANGGYSATDWRGALYAYNPAEVRQVGLHVRSPFSDGINPTNLGDWHVKWPNIPVPREEETGLPTLSVRPISSSVSSTGFWDVTTRQIIWIQPWSVGRAEPSLHIFTVPGGPSVPPNAPTNVHIIRH